MSKLNFSSFENLVDLFTNIGIKLRRVEYRVGTLTESVPYYIANNAQPRKKNITADLADIREQIANQDFHSVVPGDIIIGPNTGTEYYVAKCWGKKGEGNNEPNGGASKTPNLMLMIYKPHGITRLWAGYGDANKGWRVSANDLGRCPWNAAADVDPTDTEAVGVNNTNITRAYDNDGTTVNVSGYMGSFIRKMIDERLLVDCFQADFGIDNVLPYYNILGNAVATDKISGGQGNWNGCTSGWSWYKRYIDLPSEVELYGTRVFESAMDIGCQYEQLPFLKNGSIDQFFPRFDIWTKAVANSSGASSRGNNGTANSYGASNALWACPLACIK